VASARRRLGQLAACAQLGLGIRLGTRLGLAMGLRIRPGDGAGLGPAGAGVVAPQERQGSGDRDAPARQASPPETIAIRTEPVSDATSPDSRPPAGSPVGSHS
jgi:hypothetical protein